MKIEITLKPRKQRTVTMDGSTVKKPFILVKGILEGAYNGAKGAVKK